MLQKLYFRYYKLEISDIRVSISYFDQILGKKESQTWQLFNFAGI